MDAFALVLIAMMLALVLWIIALGRYSPGSSQELLGMKSAREITERQSELEAEDLEQMLAARNRRRMARGEAAVSADELEMQVMSEINAHRREMQGASEARRERALADAELDELLEVTNARRRARGLPDRTREQVQQEFGGS